LRATVQETTENRLSEAAKHFLSARKQTKNKAGKLSLSGGTGTEAQAPIQ
jgi:hypothetical protein